MRAGRALPLLLHSILNPMPGGSLVSIDPAPDTRRRTTLTMGSQAQCRTKGSGFRAKGLGQFRAPRVRGAWQVPSGPCTCCRQSAWRPAPTRTRRPWSCSGSGSPSTTLLSLVWIQVWTATATTQPKLDRNGGNRLHQANIPLGQVCNPRFDGGESLLQVAGLRDVSGLAHDRQLA